MSEQAELLILDAILHVATSTIHLVIEKPVTLLQVGDHEARVAAQAGVFGFDNDSPSLVPGPGAVLD